LSWEVTGRPAISVDVRGQREFGIVRHLTVIKCEKSNFKTSLKDSPFEDLFQILEKSLARLSTVDKLLFKQTDYIKKLLQSYNNEKPNAEDVNLQLLIENSQLCINFLNEHESLSETFTFHAYKLYLRLVAIKETKTSELSSKSKKR
jgi:hypothetical protein